MYKEVVFCEIKKAEESFDIIRKYQNKDSYIIFDVKDGIELRDLALTLRYCKECHVGYEYIGWNIWGKGFDKPSCYCTHCGYALQSLIEVAIVMQGNKVLSLNYRNV